jgi:hypothetical protein
MGFMGQMAATDIERPKARPLGLADALIFIIALGLGLALARPALVLIADAVRSDPRWRFQTLAGAVGLVRMLNIVLLNFLFFLLPAFLIVRLRRPRPAWHSLICQPGFVDCAAPVVIVLATLPLALLPVSELAGDVIAIVVQVLLVVAAPLAWVFLIATRRWNPEPSWIDRLGRILGALGMVCTPAHFVLIHLPY